MCLTLCDPMNRSKPGLHVHHQLPELTQTHVHRVSDAIQPSQPLLSPSPPTFNLSQHQGLFKWVSYLHQVAKVLEFQLQHQSSNKHPGLNYFRMDWLDFLAVQGTLKSLLQHYSSKASILRCSAFFTKLPTGILVNLFGGEKWPDLEIERPGRPILLLLALEWVMLPLRLNI